MRKCLIVFTRKYPYSYGETSLEMEFAYHQKLFERVIVLAEDVGKDEVITRIPPNGVEYYNTAKTSRRIGRIRDKLRCIRWGIKKNEAIAGDRERVGLKPVHNIFLWSFEERCQRLAKEAFCVLQSIDLASYEEIVLYSYWFFANARAAILVSEKLREKYNVSVRIVSRAHRYDIYEYANKLHYLPERKNLFEHVEQVFACSQDGANYLRKLYPEYIDKVNVSFLGTKDCGIGRAVKKGVFHIVSCCRIVPVKRLERLADSLALIDEPLKWTVIGGGINGNGYFNDVKKYIEKKLSTKSNILVEIMGELPHEEIFKYYENNYIDVFVNVSASEGIPQVIMEAMSFGIPVIATNVGGTGEILVDGKNGYLLPANFTDLECADAVHKLLYADQETIERFRSFSRDNWMKKFNCAVNNEWFANEIYSSKDNKQ